MASDDANVLQVAEHLEQRLAASPWDPPAQADPAADVAAFALGLSGRRKQARRGGRLSRLIVHFALAASLALATVVSACDTPDTGPEATLTAVRDSAAVSGTEALITAPPRASPARFENLVLLDAGNPVDRRALLTPLSSPGTPVIVDNQDSELDRVGGVYRLAAQPVAVGTRDGSSQFLDLLEPAEETNGSSNVDAASVRQKILQEWQGDERFAAASRASAGQPTVMDAAYNAGAAASAGGTHTYKDGVVLRVDPDNPVIQVIDRQLLESGRPTQAEDVVNVAIRPTERSLYEPGQVVTLRDVVMEQQQTTLDDGQPLTVNIANAALDGARVEPTGRVDLQSLLGSRLQRADADLALQAQELSAEGGQPQATATPAPAGAPTQQVINRYGGPSYLDDFLIFMWLTNSGFFRGPGQTMYTPPPSSTRPNGDYYYAPGQRPPGNAPATAETTRSTSTALQNARNAVSGQGAGTGGGTAATTKAASDASARASAATAKAAAVAGGVSAASLGKSVTSVPRSNSSVASRSAGSTSSSSRVTSSSGSSGFGGKGVTGSGAST